MEMSERKSNVRNSLKKQTNKQTKKQQKKKLSTCLNHVEWLSFLFSYISLHLSFRTYSTKPQNKKIKRSQISGETLNTVKLTVSALKLLFLYVQVLNITKIKRWAEDWWEGGGAVFFLSILFSYLLFPF